MKGIDFFVLRLVHCFFFWLVTSPIAFLAMAFVEYLEKHERYKNLALLLLPALFLYIFGVPWFANKTAQYMAFENHKFGLATKLAFGDLRLLLAFLPLIGHWFAPKNDDKDDD